MTKKALWIMAFLVGLTPLARAGDISGSITIPPGKVRAFARGQKKDSADPGYPDKSAEHRPTQNELKCVVVYLDGDLKCTPQTSRGSDNVIQQRDWTFNPHVVAVPKGSKVWFKNEDPFVHRVYAGSGPAHFDFKRFKGDLPVDFEAPGVVEVFCGIHTTMSCYVLVTANDFYDVTDDKGNFIIKNVPPGTYKMHVWHPRLDPFEKTVTVPKTGSVTMNLSF